MAVKLSDVAARSAVSISTVSRVLNSHRHVNEATKRRVLDAAESLGYPIPRAIREPKDARDVVLLTMHVRDPSKDPAIAGWESFNHLVGQGALPVLQTAGYRARQLEPDGRPRSAKALLHDAVPGGVIVVGGSVPAELVMALIDRSVPVVIAGAHADPERCSSVMADYLQGARDAVEHLVSLGRQRIALVSGPPTTLTSRLKADGWRLGLAANGMLADEHRHVSGEFSAHAGHDLTLEILRRAPDTDAILYADDFSALGGVKAIAEAGRAIPDDVAIVGFHDYPIAAFLSPPLTSVAFDMVRMGAMAAQRLVQLLEGGDRTPWLVQLPTHLVVRQSTRGSG
jgi:DNA-binding LacI/PurR family transcriptional regulator